jgi:hypothetical protein
VKKRWVGPGIRYIPRNYSHRLLCSNPNSISICFTGPWSETWTEENDRWIRTLTWGRREINRTLKPTYSCPSSPAEDS